MGEGPSAVLLALAVSGALHAAVALTMPSAADVPGRARYRGPPVTVSFEPSPVREPREPPEQAPEPPPVDVEPEADPAQGPDPRPRLAAVSPSPRSAAERPSEPEPPDDAEEQPEGGRVVAPDETPDDDEPAERRSDERTRSREDGMYASELAALERAAPRGQADAPELPEVEGSARARRGAAGPERDESTLDERLSDHLARAAQRRDHVSERPAPELSRRADGSYVWEGPTVGATIHPDGRVSFDDESVSVDLEEAQMGFDITSALDKAAGNDPHYAERRWFLQQTRELRDRLARRARERRGGRAVRLARERVQRIWSDGSESARARRAAIFGTWADCSEDDMGRAARRAIERFVRKRLPRGSPKGYGEVELRRLNANRASERRFAPYRVQQ